MRVWKPLTGEVRDRPLQVDAAGSGDGAAASSDPSKVECRCHRVLDPIGTGL